MKLVAESLSELMEKQAPVIKVNKDKKADIEDKIKILKKELEKAKAPGHMRDSAPSKKKKIEGIEDNIKKFKDKLKELKK